MGTTPSTSEKPCRFELSDKDYGEVVRCTRQLCTAGRSGREKTSTGRNIHAIAINGRFLTRKGTGVDRVAAELIQALDGLADERAAEIEGFTFEVLTPPGAARLRLRHIDQRVVGSRSGHVWEQTDLARASRGRWLLNFCNTGPALKRRSLVVLHDAQVYQQPGSYSPAFRWTYRVLLPLLARRSRLVFTVSDYSRRELERFGVVPPGKCRVSHNGCDHMNAIEADDSALDRFGLAGQDFVLALGSLSPHKNLSILFEAMDPIPENAPLLCIAGSAESRVFAAHGLRPTTGTRFLGRVDDRELKALLQNARALLFPSLTEGFGLPPLEAMACGCPVVASTAEAVVEVCGTAALYADVRDSSAWREAIRRLGDEASRRDAIEAGRRQAASFTWRASARRILAALREEGQ